MTTIYLSSTYSDLEPYREVVYETLRKMRYNVIAMEDYVATDQRPLDKCLADVATCDLYIGIFAWRYGYIPTEGNPEQKSITELEYRKAIETGKHCLLFLLAENAPWSPLAMDAVSGDNERGERIKALRRELVQEKVVSFFKAPEELASLVGSAVYLWEKSRTTSNTSIKNGFENEKQKEKAERETRLCALLIDHSGFIRDRLNSFVGRAKELTEIRKHINEMLPIGGYITISGQPGQGKSCIIAKLVDESNPEITAHHFIPFNPGPDYQVNLLRDLMARLILKYDLFDMYVASESRATLRDYFVKVLLEIAAVGEKEVIFIDGLDQLKEEMDGERDLSFLPNNPPEGILFVLGTRPNETLRSLELLKPHYEFKLPNMSRYDFDLILYHRQIQLDSSLVDQFYQAMQANALYLDLVAKELARRGTTTTKEIIKQLADNPENLFSLSMARLKRQPAEWREVLKPILGLLLAARESLAEQHIRQILEVDAERLSEGLERLGGLISNDGQHRYNLFHQKFRDYLRQDKINPDKRYIFALDEEEGWHSTLASWCELGNISSIWQDVQHHPIEQERREYARKYYITHLYLAREWQRLFEVLDRAEYGLGKVEDDPSMRSYAEDLDFGRQAAAWKGWTIEEGVSLLPHLWRYTLLRCSLTSRADTYTPEAFEALVRLKRVQEAVGLAELLTSPSYKVSILLLIAKLIRKHTDKENESLQLLMRTYEVAKSIEKIEKREEILLELGSVLTQVQQWERAEGVARSLKESSKQGEVLREIGRALVQIQQWAEATAVIQTIADNEQRAMALCELGIALVQAQQWERAEAIWAEGSVAALSIKDSTQRDEVLFKLSTTLAQKQLWAEATKLSRTIKSHWYRGEVLRVVGIALAEAHQWERAAEVARIIEDGEQQGEVLWELGTALVQAQQWEQAEAVWSGAVGIVRAIKDGEQRAKALCKLGTALTQAQQWDKAETIWAEAARVTGSIKDMERRSEALCKLGTALTQAQQWDKAETVWTEAARVIHTNEDNEQRAKALCELGTALIKTQQWDKAETIVRTIEDSEQRAKALRELGVALARIKQLDRAKAIWTETEAVVRTIKDSEKRAKALYELGTVVQAASIEQAEAIWTEIAAIARTFEDNEQRAKALYELGVALAQTKQWEKAETIARMIESSQQRDEMLRELGIALAQAKQWEKAETIAHTINSSQHQAAILEVLGTSLAQVQQWDQAKAIWTEAATVAYTIKDNVQRVSMLGVLGTSLAQAQQWDQAKAVWSESAKVARMIEDSVQRAMALSEMGTALARVQQWERAEAFWAESAVVTFTIEDSMQRDEMWLELGTVMAQAQYWTEATKVAHTIKGIWMRGEVLRTVGTVLARARQRKRAEEMWVEAAAVLLTSKDTGQRAKVLQEVAKVLKVGDEHEQLLRLIQRSWLQAETRHYAIDILSLATGLIPLNPEIGLVFCEAFIWVDTFLKGQ